MQSLFAYMLSVWCYVVAIVAILWLVPHVCRKYGLGAQVCVLLLAMASVVVGYEAWSVAEGGVDIADYWLFRKSLMPAATTSIIIGEYARYATRRRKERLKRIKLRADSSGTCVCPAQHLAPSGRARGETISTGAIADQSGVVS